MRKMVLLCLFSSYYCIFRVGRKQTVAVMGKLLCNDKPAVGVKIELYEKEVFFHQKLADAKTDNSGLFAISGTAKELSEIDPQLNIYHNCNYKGPCYQKLKIKIPSEYISKGKQIKKYFKINLDLATKFKGQKTDCWSFSNSQSSVWELIEPYVKYPAEQLS